MKTAMQVLQEIEKDGILSWAFTSMFFPGDLELLVRFVREMAESPCAHDALGKSGLITPGKWMDRELHDRVCRRCATGHARDWQP